VLPLKARLFSGAFASAPLQHLFRKKLGFILAQKTFAHLSHGFLRFACLPLFRDHTPAARVIEWRRVRI
jgi:hypothetical protein